MCEDEREWPRVAAGEVQVRYQEKFILQQSGDAVAKAAQGSGEVIIPGPVPELRSYGTERTWAGVGLGEVFPTSVVLR